MAASIALCCYVHHTAMRQEQGRVDKREQRNRLQQIRWRRQQSRWPPSRLERTRHLRRLLLLWARGIAAVAFLIIVICGYLLDWKWTGIPKRTLCDWLQLLIIPAVLAGGGLWFNRQQREQELQTADKRAQDEALQAYLDQMSHMLIPNIDLPSLHKARPGDSLSSVARARTLTVLSRLGGPHKARVVQFLYESGLIAKGYRIVDLSGADLSGAYLEAAHLTDANLSGADLSGAFLIGANLRGANLTEANLHQAILLHANLVKANLYKADLSGAMLDEADLISANLTQARVTALDVSGQKTVVIRADLTEANLTDAEGVTNAWIDRGGIYFQRAPYLQRATMPNGQKYEDWLKSKDRKEDGENGGSS